MRNEKLHVDDFALSLPLKKIKDTVENYFIHFLVWNAGILLSFLHFIKTFLHNFTHQLLDEICWKYLNRGKLSLYQVVLYWILFD